MNKQKKISIIAGVIAAILLATAAAIYLFFPKLYTEPNSIRSYLECENTGYSLTDSANGGKTCTLPDGTTFESNGL